MQMNAHGDDAPPMCPIGSNGASQPILDAKDLKRALSENKYCMEALDAYDKERVPATSMAVLQNRQKVPDFIMELLDKHFPMEEIKGIMNKYKQITNFDIQIQKDKN
jgi:hypothetical protein